MPIWIIKFLTALSLFYQNVNFMTISDLLAVIILRAISNFVRIFIFVGDWNLIKSGFVQYFEARPLQGNWPYADLFHNRKDCVITLKQNIEGYTGSDQKFLISKIEAFWIKETPDSIALQIEWHYLKYILKVFKY